MPELAPVHLGGSMLRLKQVARYAFVDNCCTRLLRWPPVRAILGGITAAYFLILGTVRDDFAILANYPDFHNTAFLVLVAFNVAGTVWQAIGDMIAGDRSEYTETLEELLVAVGSIISAKIFRFQLKARSITPRKDIFTLITHPEEQAQVILDYAKAFLVRRCNVKSEQFDITVIRIDPYTSSASYIAVATRNLNRTDPQDLLQTSSAAAACLASGEPLFIPDKKEAALRGDYFLSDRDNRNNGTGSLYCVPVVIPIDQNRECFLITFTTYGTTICSPGDRQAKESTRLLFDQFAKRMELELTLYAVKAAKEQAKK